jgi:hypothetical protein
MKINGIEIDSQEFAYDGCHKIYLIETEADKTEAKEGGYEILPIEELEDTFNSSCGLEFISTWSLETIVPQFEKAEFS